MSFWNSLVPHDTCVVNISQYVEKLALNLFPNLDRLAASVPTKQGKVVGPLVEVALVSRHVQNLSHQGANRNEVAARIPPRIFVEDVGKLVYFVNKRVPEAVRVDNK